MSEGNFVMKKILIFSSGSELYGSERGLLNLVDAVRDLYRITVVLPKRGPLADRLREKNIEALIFPLSILTLSWSPLYYLVSPFLFLINVIFFGFYAAWHKVDCLYTNNLLLVFPSVIAGLLRKKHIWHMREFFPAGWVNRWIVWMARASKSKIICMSQNIKDVLFPGNAGDSAVVIYEGIKAGGLESGAFFCAAIPNIPPDAVTLTVISRIHPSKGQLELVELLAEISEASRKKARLLMIGDISPRNLRGILYKRKIKKFIRSHNMTRNVLWLGFQQDIPAILSAVDICVFPFRRNEPFGLALLEALALSKRVLITLNPGSREILEHFEGKWRELSPVSLSEEIGRGKFPPVPVSIPEIFSFKNYERNIRSFLRGVEKT